jgi:hypothetical protein
MIWKGTLALSTGMTRHHCQRRLSKDLPAEEWAQRRKGILEQQATLRRVKFVLPIDARLVWLLSWLLLLVRNVLFSLPLRLMLGKVNLTLPVMDQR